jgi:hypothetical protein
VALVPPVVALAQEQPPAEERAEDADGARGAAVVGMVVNQHPADAVRVVDQNPVTPKEDGGDDILLIGSLRPDGQRVFAVSGEDLILG